MNMFYNILAVFFGGGVGCVLRFLAGSGVWPLLGINLIGGFLIGILFARPDIQPVLKTALTVGLCGGLTTFSTFSLELFKMFEAGQFIQAIAYAFLSVIICLLAVAAGVYCAKFV